MRYGSDGAPLVSELIDTLKQFKKQHGDMPVWVEDGPLTPVGEIKVAITNGTHPKIALIGRMVNPMAIVNPPINLKGKENYETYGSTDGVSYHDVVTGSGLQEQS